jgi:hypothetical protein
VTLLLPQLVAGLGSGAGRDFASATFMILGRLAGRATLGAKLLNGGSWRGSAWAGKGRPLTGRGALAAAGARAGARERPRAGGR